MRCVTVTSTLAPKGYRFGRSVLGARVERQDRGQDARATRETEAEWAGGFSAVEGGTVNSNGQQTAYGRQETADGTERKLGEAALRSTASG